MTITVEFKRTITYQVKLSGETLGEISCRVKDAWADHNDGGGSLLDWAADGSTMIAEDVFSRPRPIRRED